MGVASLTVKVEGARLLMLPFEANVPDGVKAYTIGEDLTVQEVEKMAAHQPVLVEAEGEVTFTGSGEVSYATSPIDGFLRGTYVGQSLYAGDYLFGQENGQWGFRRQTVASHLAPFGVYVQLNSKEAFVPLDWSATAIEGVAVDAPTAAVAYYDLQGRKLEGKPAAKGMYIRKGKKVMVK